MANLIHIYAIRFLHKRIKNIWGRVAPINNRNMKKQLLIIIGLALVVFACSSPLDKKINKETIAKDLERSME